MTWSLWPFCGSVRALSRVSPQLQRLLLRKQQTEPLEVERTMFRLRLPFLLALFALQEMALGDQEACGEEEVEAVEMAEAEALKTELLQVKVSSSGTFDEEEVSSFLQGNGQASVVIDDMADFPTMLVQTDMELTPTETAV
eukprot:symbB.v1.2.008908.t1/scaffold560.1/size187392/3